MTKTTKPKKKTDAKAIEVKQEQEQAQVEPSPSIEATQEIIEAVDELRRLEGLKKRLLELEEANKQKVMTFMGTHHKLQSGAFCLASWKTQTRRSFDTSALKTEMPDLYNSYIKETQHRVFRLC